MGRVKLDYQGQPGQPVDVPARASTGAIGWSQLVNVPTEFPPGAHFHAPGDIDGLAFHILGLVVDALPGLVFAGYCRGGVWDLRGLSGMLGGRREVTYVWIPMSPGDPELPVNDSGAIPGHDLVVTSAGVRLVPGVASAARVDVAEVAASWNVLRAADAGRVDVAEVTASWNVLRAVVARVDVAEVVASWAVQRVAETNPKGLLGGTMGRSLSQSMGILETLIKPGIVSPARPRSTVVEIDWDVIQKSAGVLDPTAVTRLRADIATARTHGMTVLLRVFMGWYAPQFVKDAVGVLGFRHDGSDPRWYTDDGSDGDRTLPPAPSTPGAYPLKRAMVDYTDPAFLGYASKLTELLAAAVGDEPNLVAVSMSWPMTQYAEPAIKQFSMLENRIAAVSAWVRPGGVWTLKPGAGWTLERELAVWQAGFEAHRDFWSPRGVATACAFNPLQTLNLAKSPPNMKAGDYPATSALMDQMLSILGPRFAILENNSVGAILETGAWKWDEYPAMYQHMKELHDSTGVRLHLQTETRAKHQKKHSPTSPLNTHRYAAAWGSSSVEISVGGHLATDRVGDVGWPAWTLADATTANDALTANSPSWFV